MLCAGSFMHFVLAFVLIFGLALGIGIENDNTTQLGTISQCVAANTTQLNKGTCAASDQASPRPSWPGCASETRSRRSTACR